MQEMLAGLTEKLCAIASPIGDEAALAAFVAEAGEESYPGEVERIGNSVIFGKVSGARPALLLLGHLDTVPLQEGDFPARREGGRVFGRGASDMKGALAVMLALGRRFAAERAGLAVELVMAFYDREEGPYDQNGLGPLLEARPDLKRATLGICLEPTDLALQLGCCGALHATLSFTGRAAHSARPWQGENAITKAGALLQFLHSRQPRDVQFGELVYREVMTATRIDGFTGRNVVPARCDVNVNFRFAPGRAIDDAAGELEELSNRFGAICKVTDRSPSGPVFGDNALVQRLRAITGVPVEPKQAWTDVARLALAGIPAVNFGPGEQAQAHQKGESCGEAALERAYSILEKFLVEL